MQKTVENPNRPNETPIQVSKLKQTLFVHFKKEILLIRLQILQITKKLKRNFQMLNATN